MCRVRSEPVGVGVAAEGGNEAGMCGSVARGSKPALRPRTTLNLWDNGKERAFLSV